MRTAKTLIRLGGCPGLSESSLGTHSFCWFCHFAAHLFLVKIQSGAIFEQCNDLEAIIPLCITLS